MRAYWFARWLGSQSGNGDAPQASRNGQGTEASASVWGLVDTNEALAGELARARRYERDFSIAVVSRNPGKERLDGTGNGAKPATPQQDSLRRIPLPVAAAGLREALRESDILCYDDAHECFVLGLAESDREAAGRAVKRVRMLFSSRLQLELAVGVAHFPDDRLTLGDLVETARDRAESGEVSGARIGGSEGDD